MPKIKGPRKYTELLYCYVKPANFKFMERKRKKAPVGERSRSAYIDSLIERVRRGEEPRDEVQE